jgi:hypothetical protein
MIVAGGEVEPIDSKAHREKKSQVHVDPTSTPDQHGALISHFCNQKHRFLMEMFYVRALSTKTLS